MMHQMFKSHDFKDVQILRIGVQNLVTGGHGLVTGRLDYFNLRGLCLVTGWSRVGHGLVTGIYPVDCASRLAPWTN